ncbi:MAG: histidine--tRNA ligase [Bacteroidales bacterium]|nr:histidine--tRNA ligase [Bacteroidales bacterium]
MASQKPSIPKGTRDFTPEEMVKRNYIFNTIRQVFQLYGYQPIETPAMENLSTLLGKYGDEGDKLLYKILNSGDFLSHVAEEDLKINNSAVLAGKIAEKGLRYDLTVPFARFVVQHRNEIVFPFKRYQIQPVWRADRPQAGRYREFYQCDVDVIGSDSLLNEVELIQIIHDIFEKLNIRVIVKLNNRKILAGIAEIIGETEKMTDITVAIDKLDKIGLEKVNQELLEKGISADAISKLQPILLMTGSDSEKFKVLEEVLTLSEMGMKGIRELKEVFEDVRLTGLDNLVELDLTLARGLNYYTGAIIEAKAADVQIGSICGGGRYDDLTGIFGMPGTSGVGISFGADRIYDVMNQSNLFPDTGKISTQVFFVNFGKAEEKYCLQILKKVRGENISAELYPEAAKMKKQMAYADKNHIPWVVLAGKNELENEMLSVKNMRTGEQEQYSVSDFIQLVKS